MAAGDRPRAFFGHGPALQPRHRQRVRQLRRPGLRHGQCAGSVRSWRRDGVMGADCGHRVELASAHVAVARAGCFALRVKPARPSRHECAAARAQRGVGVFSAGPADGRALDQRSGCGAVGLASVARRIRGLGGGAQGCPERPVLVCRLVGLRHVRRTAAGGAARRGAALCGRARGLCPRPDGEADARDPAVRASAAGRLAAASLAAGPGPKGFGRRHRLDALGEDSVLRAVGGIERRHLPGAGARRVRVGRPDLRRARGQRLRRSCALFGELRVAL